MIKYSTFNGKKVKEGFGDRETIGFYVQNYLK